MVCAHIMTKSPWVHQSTISTQQHTSHLGSSVCDHLTRCLKMCTKPEFSPRALGSSETAALRLRVALALMGVVSVAMGEVSEEEEEDPTDDDEL